MTLQSADTHLQLLREIGRRLREERERLGHSQTSFADLAKVTRKTVFGYENGDRCPAGAVLSAWAGIGADVAYILTGTRAGAVTPDHTQLNLVRAKFTEKGTSFHAWCKAKGIDWSYACRSITGERASVAAKRLRQRIRQAAGLTRRLSKIDADDVNDFSPEDVNDFSTETARRVFSLTGQRLRALKKSTPRPLGNGEVSP